MVLYPLSAASRRQLRYACSRISASWRSPPCQTGPTVWITALAGRSPASVITACPGGHSPAADARFCMLQELRACGPVNGTVHPATTHQGGIGCVDDHVNVHRRDIAMNNVDLRSHKHPLQPAFSPVYRRGRRRKLPRKTSVSGNPPERPQAFSVHSGISC